MDSAQTDGVLLLVSMDPREYRSLSNGYLNGFPLNAGNSSAKTAEQFASGEVAYLLGEAWGQAIGTDAYPVLGGAKVYKGYASCTATEMSYANEELPTTMGHIFGENGKCKCGTQAAASVTIGGNITYHLTLGGGYRGSEGLHRRGSGHCEVCHYAE